MFIEIERYVNFISKHKLTQTQFLILYLLYRKRWDLIKVYLEAFPRDPPNKLLSDAEKKDLIDRGFIIPVGVGNTGDDYELGHEFRKLFTDGVIASQELLTIYPSFIVVNNKRYPTKLMDEHQLSVLYAEKIGHEFHEHIEVLKDVAYGIENGLITCGIEKFVRSSYWNVIREVRNNKVVEVKSDEVDF